MFKKIAIIIFSDVISALFLIVTKIFALFRFKGDRNALRILIYHSVSDSSFYKDASENNVSVSMLKKHIESLLQGQKKVVNLSEGVEALKRNTLKGDCVAITFDDGMTDVYEEAVKVLEDLKIPATFFIVYDYADGSDRRFMDWDMVRTLKNKGFEIGSHSYSHVRLGILSAPELKEEALRAKTRFDEKDMKVDYFAYPYGFYGDFTKKTGEALREAGFKAAFTSVMGENRHGDDLFELKRTRVSWRDTPLQFKMKLEGAYDWVDQIKRVVPRRRKPL